MTSLFIESRRDSGVSASKEESEAKPSEAAEAGYDKSMIHCSSSPSSLKAVAEIVSCSSPCVSKSNYQIIWLDQSLDTPPYQIYISALYQLNFTNLERAKSHEDFLALFNNKLLQKHVLIIVNDSCSQAVVEHIRENPKADHKFKVIIFTHQDGE